jgi:hypothetical protein
MTRFSPWVLDIALRALTGAAQPFSHGDLADPLSSFLHDDAPAGPRHKRGKARKNHKKAIAARKRRRT